MPEHITVKLTADQLSNVQTALEHFLDYLDDHGAKDYPAEDLPEIIDSVKDALDAVGDAGYCHITRPTTKAPAEWGIR